MKRSTKTKRALAPDKAEIVHDLKSEISALNATLVRAKDSGLQIRICSYVSLDKMIKENSELYLSTAEEIIRYV